MVADGGGAITDWDDAKESLRQAWQEAALSPFPAGKVAELLRKQSLYRQSRTLFVAPLPRLQQIRINALLDGKTLIMPGAAIKKGFYCFAPYGIAFKDLGHAVSLKGLEQFGERLGGENMAHLHVDLALTDCLAVDGHGNRLGWGTGFFDLAMAILAEQGAVDGSTVYAAVGVPEQLSETSLPQAPWDLRMNYFLNGHDLLALAPNQPPPTVIWSAVDRKRIRKIEPLWQLYQVAFPGP